MDCKIHYSDNFQKELDAIVGYIALDLYNEKAARDLIDDTYAAIAKLSVFPLACPLCDIPRLAAKGIRKLVVNNYVVLYSVTENGADHDVNILHLIYGGRNYGELLPL